MVLTFLLSAAKSTIKAMVASRKPVSFNETDVSEKFIRGWGKGGQAVNTCSNAVYLKHHPTNIEIKTRFQCHAYRSLDQNRKEARKILLERLDGLINGSNSKGAIEAAKIKERKRQAAKKRRKKQREAEYNKPSNMSDIPIAPFVLITKYPPSL